nr:unnamed protein product [Callosobruchus analis]
MSLLGFKLLTFEHVLPELQQNQSILIQEKPRQWRPGVVVSKSRLKDYIAEVSAAQYRRNGQHIRMLCTRSTNFLYKTNYDDLGYKVSKNLPKKKSKLTFPPQSEAPIRVSKAKKDTIIKALVPKMKNTWRLFWLELPENASAKDLLEEICKNISTSNARRTSDRKAIASLKEKDCFYLKADKGNKVVILDKKDYFDRVDKLIEEGPYKKITKNPLPKMVNQVKTTLSSCRYLVAPPLKRKLQVSNATVSKLYCLPKIHKPGKAMRPIVSAIGSPTYNISKFLVDEFKKLRLPFESRSVVNSNEFINKIKDLKLNENEILVSFDISSLFPSVPVPKTLEYLRELLTYNNYEQVAINELIMLTQLSMAQNVFQYKGEFFEQHEGTAMGNCLSPSLAELFMNYFEETLV